MASFISWSRRRYCKRRECRGGNRPVGGEQVFSFADYSNEHHYCSRRLKEAMLYAPSFLEIRPWVRTTVMRDPVATALLLSQAFEQSPPSRSYRAPKEQ